ncbi:MAG: PolC-type DNA polymerase III [Clostridia bacterium]|nr:PolC-type DNA polymerase III [Clostridia bacterium]
MGVIIVENNEIIWGEVVDFFSKKYVAIKAALGGSTIDVQGDVVNVNLKSKSKFMLEQRNSDKLIEEYIRNSFGKNVQVFFKEPEVIEDSLSKEQEIIRNLLEKQKREQEERQKEGSQNTPTVPNARSAQAPSTQARSEGGNSNVSNSTNIPMSSEEYAAGMPQKSNSTPKDTFRNNRKKGMEFLKDPEMLIFKGWKVPSNPKEIKIANLSPEQNEIIISGKVSNYDSRETKNGGFLISFDIYDGSSSINVKAFLKANEYEEVHPRMKKIPAVRLVGTYEYNSFSKEFGVIASMIEETTFEEKKRMDNSEEKRVELHLHTQMSQMDAVSSATDLIKTAIKWGHKAIAITDHGVAQSYPEAKKAAKDSDIKVIYGVEAYLAPDSVTSVYEAKSTEPLDDLTYCVLDIETTGLSRQTEKITEFGIMKVKNGEVIDTFECFVNPEKPIPPKVVEVTHITDDMVKDAETIDKVMPKVIEFVGDSIVVAHNANFDVGFIRHNAEQLGLKFDNTFIDTLALAKEIYPDFKKYKLGYIAEQLNIKVDVAHRALADVETLVAVFNVMLGALREKEITTLNDIDSKLAEDVNFKTLPTYHAVILASNKVGLKNLYKLISYSHVDYFYKKPRILKSLLMKHSEGLILGSACEQGELFRAIVDGKSEEDLEAIAEFYDYLEIQPIGNNMFMVRNGTVPSVDTLIEFNKKIVALGEKMNKPVVATCDVHFLNPEDEVYRRILQAGQGYDDADEQAPLYFRTTEELLKEFQYLGSEKAYEVVVTNTNKIADMCEKINPIADYKATPHIEGCEETIRNITMKRAIELYGDPLPEIVQARIDKELDSIIKNGFSVMYIIAQKLVNKSNEDGYLVGSRGSVGSSFVANMTGITEVNSLQPHYRCPNCKYSDFTDYNIKNGFDLPDKECPKCGTMLAKDGMDIPFETFLGFDGDKEPDIDLNFSGEYQAKAHKYTEVIFGKGTTFKAGTIGTIADKTAFGYVKKYYEERHIPVNVAETTRLSVGCTGVKRTSGQHPGGIIVVPKGNEIYEFCPVQHPADDAESNIITTHFDYHSIDQNLLKLDILGHDDPTMIRMLQDLTDVDPQKIPLDDKETMSIFSSTKALGVTPEQIHSEVGTFGVPEFGTKFVRGMLLDTKPTKFEELLRISGLSHGTDVWLNNAQTLIQEGTIQLEDAICTRDDIMIYLIKQGLPPKPSFKIMESVRKGKGLSEEQETMMRENNVPEWYINSCKKIKYMFPKAHAAAYVTMAFRIAWFKVHIPLAYYASYFSIRADAFESDSMIYGKEKVINKMREIDLQGNAATAKDKDMYGTLEIVLEMYERGFEFLPIDLYKSDAKKFLIEDGKIRPPLNSIAGLGTVAAENIQQARNTGGTFMSIEELKLRAGIGKSVIEMLKNANCLKGMTESNQMSLFTY